MGLNLTEFTKNVNAHQSLPAQPSLTSNELKQAWDKPASDIKDYLNNSLITELEEQFAGAVDDEIDAKTSAIVAQANTYADEVGTSTLSSAKSYTDGKITTVNNSISSLNGTINTLSNTVSGLNTTTGKKTVYGDFAVSTVSDSNRSIAADKDYTGTITATKSGYYPLGIVGMNSQSIVWFELHRYQLTSRSSGSATVTYQARNKDWQNSRTGTFTFDILWVKVR